MSGLLESPRTYYRRAAGARRDCVERRRAVEAHSRRGSSPYVLDVTLRNDAGEEWQAVGGGATLAEALAFAVESAPSQGRWTAVESAPSQGRWTAVAWEDLYGA